MDLWDSCPNCTTLKSKLLKLNEIYEKKKELVNLLKNSFLTNDKKNKSALTSQLSSCVDLRILKDNEYLRTQLNSSTSVIVGLLKEKHLQIEENKQLKDKISALEDQVAGLLQTIERLNSSLADECAQKDKQGAKKKQKGITNQLISVIDSFSAVKENNELTNDFKCSSNSSAYGSQSSLLSYFSDTIGDVTSTDLNLTVFEKIDEVLERSNSYENLNSPKIESVDTKTEYDVKPEIATQIPNLTVASEGIQCKLSLKTQPIGIQTEFIQGVDKSTQKNFIGETVAVQCELPTYASEGTQCQISLETHPIGIQCHIIQGFDKSTQKNFIGNTVSVQCELLAPPPVLEFTDKSPQCDTAKKEVEMFTHKMESPKKINKPSCGSQEANKPNLIPESPSCKNFLATAIKNDQSSKMFGSSKKIGFLPFSSQSQSLAEVIKVYEHFRSKGLQKTTLDQNKQVYEDLPDVHKTPSTEVLEICDVLKSMTLAEKKEKHEEPPHPFFTKVQFNNDINLRHTYGYKDKRFDGDLNFGKIAESTCQEIEDFPSKDVFHNYRDGKLLVPTQNIKNMENFKTVYHSLSKLIETLPTTKILPEWTNFKIALEKRFGIDNNETHTDSKANISNNNDLQWPTFSKKNDKNLFEPVKIHPWNNNKEFFRDIPKPDENNEETIPKNCHESKPIDVKYKEEEELAKVNQILKTTGLKRPNDFDDSEVLQLSKVQKTFDVVVDVKDSNQSSVLENDCIKPIIEDKCAEIPQLSTKIPIDIKKLTSPIKEAKSIFDFPNENQVINKIEPSREDNSNIEPIDVPSTSSTEIYELASKGEANIESCVLEGLICEESAPSPKKTAFNTGVADIKGEKHYLDRSNISVPGDTVLLENICNTILSPIKTPHKNGPLSDDAYNHTMTNFQVHKEDLNESVVSTVSPVFKGKTPVATKISSAKNCALDVAESSSKLETNNSNLNRVIRRGRSRNVKEAESPEKLPSLKIEDKPLNCVRRTGRLKRVEPENKNKLPLNCDISNSSHDVDTKNNFPTTLIAKGQMKGNRSKKVDFDKPLSKRKQPSSIRFVKEASNSNDSEAEELNFDQILLEMRAECRNLRLLSPIPDDKIESIDSFEENKENKPKNDCEVSNNQTVGGNLVTIDLITDSELHISTSDCDIEQSVIDMEDDEEEKMDVAVKKIDSVVPFDESVINSVEINEDNNFVISFYRNIEDVEEENIEEEIENLALDNNSCDSKEEKLVDCKDLQYVHRVATDEGAIPCGTNALYTVLKYFCEEEPTITVKQEKPDSKTLEKINEVLNNYCLNPFSAELCKLALEELKNCSTLDVAKIIYDIFISDTEDYKNLQLSSLQKRLLLLLFNFEKFNQIFISTVLDTFENNLVSFSDTKDEKKVIIFHTTMCKKLNLLDRSRNLVYDVLYSRGVKAFPMVFNMINIWPHVLPKLNRCKDCYLTYSIAIVLSKCPNHSRVSQQQLNGAYNFNELQKLLRSFYNYRFLNMESEELFKKCFNDITRKESTKALVLLCKSHGYQWSVKMMKEVVFPRLRQWLKDEENDESVAEMVVALGQITRGFPSLNAQYNIGLIFNLLNEMLQQSTSLIVTDAVIESITMMRKHNLVTCANIFANWCPSNKIITKVSLSNFKKLINLKSPKYWKNFINNYNSR